MHTVRANEPSPTQLSGQFAPYTRTISYNKYNIEDSSSYSSLRLFSANVDTRRINFSLQKIRVFPIQLSVFSLAYDHPRLVKASYLT